MISLVSAIGVALGTAALILILSVYNGFNGVVDDNLSDFDPDLLLCRVDGRGVFHEGEAAPFVAGIQDDSTVLDIIPRLDVDVLVTYDGNEGSALARGFGNALYHGELPLASVGAGLAQRMGINPRFSSAIELCHIDRSRPLVVSNPSSALRREKVFPGGFLSVSTEVDDRLMVIPMETARSLYGMEDVVSGIEIRLADASPKGVKSFIRRVSAAVPDGFCLKDRARQHPELYRMMRLEKAAVFLILIIVVLVVALNIFGSLSMLVIEKADDVATLKAMGADDALIRRIFILEGWLVSLAGLVTGLAAGVALALLQQHFGIVKMPGNYLVDAYPVILKSWDVVLTAVGVAAIGLLVSLAPVRKNL